MTSLLHSLTANSSSEAKNQFTAYLEVAVQLYRRWGGLLKISSFRTTIGDMDEHIGKILDLIYMEHAISRQDIRYWLAEQRFQSTELQGASSSPGRIDEVLGINQDVGVIEQDDQIGLTLQAEGKIYKRLLKKDIEKLLR